MVKVDLTVTISVIIAICAIVSPILTAIINNRHQLKIRKLETQERLYENTVTYKRKIFEDYLIYLGRCIAFPSNETVKEYGKHYLVALMYASANMQSKMISINSFIQAENFSSTTNDCEELTVLIHKYLQEL